MEDDLTQATQELMDSDAYRTHTTRLGETRKPSHIEIGALLIQDGHAPASISRICKALARLGWLTPKTSTNATPQPSHALAVYHQGHALGVEANTARTQTITGAYASPRP